jgi:hypothetical protein
MLLSKSKAKRAKATTDCYCSMFSTDGSELGAGMQGCSLVGLIMPQREQM